MTLLILVSGLRRGYLSLNPLTSIGPYGEMLMDYSIYDAKQAGFNKIVFVVNERFALKFQELMLPKFDASMKVVFIEQKANDLPCKLSDDLYFEEPCGASHAIWAARNYIKEPFFVINARNYFGKNAYKVAFDFLSNDPKNFALLGYHLKQTLSNYGGVDRDICFTYSEGKGMPELTDMVSIQGIRRNHENKLKYKPHRFFKGELQEDKMVSLNTFCFTPVFFDLVEACLVNYIKSYQPGLSKELGIPKVLRYIVKNTTIAIKVLNTNSNWFGITYKPDRIMATYKLEDKIKYGSYPHALYDNINKNVKRKSNPNHSNTAGA